MYAIGSLSISLQLTQISYKIIFLDTLLLRVDPFRIKLFWFMFRLRGGFWGTPL